MKKSTCRQIVKWYIKRIPKNQRQLRLCFVGKRLAVLQDKWAHRG